MANLNLSEFTEKTLVADADWVFVWDTAGTISKKVSRNSLLNSGTLATSAPVTISQTWDALAVAFTAFKVNATSTNSASGSLLADFQVGGVSKLSVDKSGIIALPQTGGDASALICGGSAITNAASYIGIYGLRLDSTTAISWAAGKNLNALDTILLRDGAANTLALRNGAAAQTFNVYGTSSSSNTVYERMFTKYNGTDLAFQIGTETAGATLRPLDFVTGGSRRMTIGTTGNVGIGTTAPATTLEVNGSLRITGVGQFGPTSTYYGLALFRVGTSTMAAQIYGDVNGLQFTSNGGADTVRILNSGNVGIGTTAPSSKLHVYLNPANNYTTEKVQFGNSFFGNGVSGYSFMWMGGISTPLTLSNSNYVLASDGSGTILNSPSTSGITFQVGGSNRWSINTSGHFLAAADNSYDIGASGANRPKDIYAGGNGIFAGLVSATNGFRAPGSSQLIASADGVWRLTNSSANDFNRLQFGGTSASFPAIKRSSTTLQARLADDSAFAPIQGKLTTDTAYTAGAITDTGYIVLYDSAGTAYKVACTPV